jgi:hypothetical protein
MSTELWAALGTTLATLVFLLIPGVVYVYEVLESWIDDPASYERVIEAVERATRTTGQSSAVPCRLSRSSSSRQNVTKGEDNESLRRRSERCDRHPARPSVDRARA